MSHKEIAARLSIVSLILGIGAYGVSWLHSEFASAADVQALGQLIYNDRVDRLELAIARVEREMKYLQSIPAAQRTDYQNQRLAELQFEKEALLRKLKRVEAGE